MRRVRLDIVLIAVGATIIGVCVAVSPPSVVSTVAGAIGFLLILAGAYVALRRFSGPPPSSSGVWGNVSEGGQGGHVHHGGGWHGGMGHGGGHGGGHG